MLTGLGEFSVTTVPRPYVLAGFLAKAARQARRTVIIPAPTCPDLHQSRLQR